MSGPSAEDLRARIAELEAELKDASDAYWREREQHEADRLAKDTEIGRLRRELAEACRRYEERTPTQWAYEQACHALEKHRERADAAEAEVKRLTDLNAQYADRAVDLTQRAERAEADLARSKDVAIREAEQVRSERNRYAERAEQAEALLRVAHDTSNTSEAERLRAVRRAEQAEGELEELTLGLQAAETWRERNLKVAQEAIELMNKAAAERDQLRAAAERVRALHKPASYPSPDGPGEITYCVGCEESDSSHPCPTIRALDQAPAAEQDGGGR